MKNLVISTPWEEYNVDGISVYVKREDLCCPGGPPFSKMRGVQMHIENVIAKLRYKPIIGVVDTGHSMAGWGVAYACHNIGLQCVNYFPGYVREKIGRAGGIILDNITLRKYQLIARDVWNAKLVVMPAGRSAVLHAQARNMLRKLGGSYMMPNALKLRESVTCTAIESNTTPENLLRGTWIISISSGTVASGVMAGIQEYQERIQFVIHMGYSRSKPQAQKYMANMAGYVPYDWVFIDDGYEYKDKVEYPCPFPCNEYYDLKAWKWLCEHIYDLEQPIIFWNIGA